MRSVRPLYWLAAVLIAGGVALLSAEPAECVWCPTYKCWGPCGGDCVCVSPPGGGGGSCYGIERAPSLVAKGWRVIE